jgi:hypothetical protein
MAATCTCDVPVVAFGRRDARGPDTKEGRGFLVGLVPAYAVACTTCRTAAQSADGFEHAFMLLRNGPCRPPVIEEPGNG